MRINYKSLVLMDTQNYDHDKQTNPIKINIYVNYKLENK
jgi:hypothetical protein